jgi:hypothetical protein
MSNKENSFQPGVAVSAVFEEVKPLQEQLSRIALILEPMQQLSELANVFQPLREFESKIKDLAKLLDPMRNFQDQLRRVLQQFGPLQGLDHELDQLSMAFHEGLSQLAAALEPAASLQDRLAHLAGAFRFGVRTKLRRKIAGRQRVPLSRATRPHERLSDHSRQRHRVIALNRSASGFSDYGDAKLGDASFVAAEFRAARPGAANVPLIATNRETPG